MSVQAPATLAIAFGGITLLGCLVIIPSLVSEIQSIRQELDMEMGTFRVSLLFAIKRVVQSGLFRCKPTTSGRI